MVAHFLEVVPNRTKIRIPGKEPVINVLHGITINRGLTDSPIGLSLPDYVSNPEAPSLGKRIRLIGSLEDLKELLNNDQILESCSRGLIQLRGIKPVPDDVTYARFIRDRSFDKACKKAKILGEPSPWSPEFFLPHFSRTSQNTNNQHLVFVRKEIVSDPCPGNYSSFGLSRNGSTVPVWR